MATIPAATALAMLPAAAIGYIPQYVVLERGCGHPDRRTAAVVVHPKGGGSAAEAKAATGLLNGVITDAYFAPETDVSNPWVQVEKKLLARSTRPALYAKSGLDGNTQYGIALAYTFVQALQAAGKNLTRRPVVGHRQVGQELRHPGLRAPVVLEQRALRLPGGRGDQAQQHRSAGGDPDR